MSHVIKPSVNIFFVKDDKVLLGRRANTGWMDGYLCPPGGHVEQGETPSIAAIRELKEELGIEVSPDDLEFLCVAAHNGSPAEYVAYEFVVRDKAYRTQNTEPEKCSELVWVDTQDLPADIVEHFRQIIAQSLVGGKPYLELGY